MYFVVLILSFVFDNGFTNCVENRTKKPNKNALKHVYSFIGLIYVIDKCIHFNNDINIGLTLNITASKNENIHSFMPSSVPWQPHCKHIKIEIINVWG